MRRVNMHAGGNCQSGSASDELLFKPLLFPESQKYEPQDKQAQLAPQWELFHHRTLL